MLDRLVGRAVLPEEDGVVGEHPDAGGTHEGPHPDGPPHVVTEDKEGAAVAAQPPVEGQPVDDGSHAVLAHPEVDVAARRSLGTEVGGTDDVRLRRAGEVGRAADQSGSHPGEDVEGRAGGCPGGHRLARHPLRRQVHRFRRVVGIPAFSQPVVGRQRGIAYLLPLAAGSGVLFHPGGEVVPNLVGYQEKLIERPPHRLLRSRDLLGPERRPVGLGGVLLGGCPVPDVGAAQQERWLVCHRQRRLGGLGDGRPIVAVDGQRVPTVRPEPAGDVLGERPVGGTIEADPVVVVEEDGLAQLVVTGERGRLRGNALHEVAVGDEGERPVIDEVVAEDGVEVLLGHRQPDRRAEALAQRAGRRLDTEMGLALGVAGRRRPELAEGPDVIEGDTEARQVEQGVQQHGGVPVREHEAVAIGPQRLLGIDLQVPAPQHDGDVGHPHRGPGVPGGCTLDRVHGQGLDGVGGELLDVHPGHATTTRSRLDWLSRRPPSAVTTTMSSMRIPQAPPR